MIWVTWRQQRTESLVAVGILVLLVAVLVPTGVEMASTYHRDGLSACLGQNGSYSCAQAIEGFGNRFALLSALLNWTTLLPGLVGILLAVPLVLDVENGTYRLAWTQSVTRRRWIAWKLALPIGTAMLIAGALSLLITWWRTPWVHLDGRLDSGTFDSEGIVVFGYTLFALAFAMAVGVVWRRTAPAVIVAFVGYLVARIFVDTWLRQRLVAPLSAAWKGNQPGPDLSRAWVLNMSGVGPAPSAACQGGVGRLSVSGHFRTVVQGCRGQSRLITNHAVYQPASHFWPLQEAETALFAGTALALFLFAAWWTHERLS